MIKNKAKSVQFQLKLSVETELGKKSPTCVIPKVPRFLGYLIVNLS